MGSFDGKPDYSYGLHLFDASSNGVGFTYDPYATAACEALSTPASSLVLADKFSPFPDLTKHVCVDIRDLVSFFMNPPLYFLEHVLGCSADSMRRSRGKDLIRMHPLDRMEELSLFNTLSLNPDKVELSDGEKRDEAHAYLCERGFLEGGPANRMVEKLLGAYPDDGLQDTGDDESEPASGAKSFDVLCSSERAKVTVTGVVKLYRGRFVVSSILDDPCEQEGVYELIGLFLNLLAVSLSDDAPDALEGRIVGSRGANSRTLKFERERDRKWRQDALDRLLLVYRLGTSRPLPIDARCAFKSSYSQTESCNYIDSKRDLEFPVGGKFGWRKDQAETDSALWGEDFDLRALAKEWMKGEDGLSRYLCLSDADCGQREPYGLLAAAIWQDCVAVNNDEMAWSSLN